MPKSLNLNSLKTHIDLVVSTFTAQLQTTMTNF